MARRWLEEGQGFANVTYLNDLIQCMLYFTTKQLGEMKGNEIRLFLMSRIMIPIRLSSLHIHSPAILQAYVCWDPLSTEIMLGECVRNAQVLN